MRCIDADALIERLEDDIKAIEDIEPVIAMGGIGALNTIKKAPTVEPERPKGEWIFNPKDAIDLMFTKPKCNKCGFESADGGNFCPNCGAMMKGADDE